MFDVDKLKYFLRFCAALALFLYCANFVFALTTALFPTLLPHQFFGVDFVEDNRQRAAGASAQYRDGTLDENEPLIVILGLSSASEGIKISLLGDRLNSDARVLSLSGAGRNMQEVSRYARLLIDRDVRPELVVFAISSFHLIDTLPAKSNFANSLQHGSALIEMLGFSLLVRRQDVKYAADIAIFDARSHMFKIFDVRVDETGASPWRENVRMGLVQMRSDEQWRDNLQRYGLRGYYNTDAFSHSNTQFAVFVDLIADFLLRDSNILVILMPEHSMLRERIPDEVMNRLTDLFDQEFDANKPIVIDFRAAIPDTGFKDISHMNESGRVEFSSMLADEIENHQFDASFE